MTVYAIAQLRVTDCGAYNRYQSRFMDVFRRHHGTLPTADERPQVVEGSWDRENVVLMSFPGESEFRPWSESIAYQKISIDRDAGADTVVLLGLA